MCLFSTQPTIKVFPHTMPSVALAGFGEHPQVFRQDVRVGDDGVHDSKPCLRSSVQIRGVEGVRGVTRRRKQKNARETNRLQIAYVVQRLVVDARTEYRDGHGSTPPAARARGALAAVPHLRPRRDPACGRRETRRARANTSAARRGNCGRSSSVGWTGTRSFLDSSPSCVAQSTWSG